MIIKSDFFKVINQVDNLKKDEIVDFLKETPVFSKYSKSYLRKLAASILEMPTIKNQVIVKEGRKSDTLYIVREGEFGVYQREVFQDQLYTEQKLTTNKGGNTGVKQVGISKFAKGQIFGEELLIEEGMKV